MTTTSTAGSHVGPTDDDSSTSEKAQQVAGTAQDEAKRVAQTANEQLHGLMGDARSQVEDQSRTQRDRLVTTLGSFGSDLDEMAADKGGPAAELTRAVAQRARTLGDHLDGREPSDLLQDVRGFARQRPGLFLVGALTAGVVLGRFVRGAKAESPGAAAGAGSTPSGGTTPSYASSSDTSYVASPYDTVETPGIMNDPNGLGGIDTTSSTEDPLVGRPL